MFDNLFKGFRTVFFDIFVGIEFFGNAHNAHFQTRFIQNIHSAHSGFLPCRIAVVTDIYRRGQTGQPLCLFFRKGRTHTRNGAFKSRLIHCNYVHVTFYHHDIRQRCLLLLFLGDIYCKQIVLLGKNRRFGSVFVFTVVYYVFCYSPSAECNNFALHIKYRDNKPSR